MQTTQKISKHIKTNELFEQLQSCCDNPLINSNEQKVSILKVLID